MPAVMRHMHALPEARGVSDAGGARPVARAREGRAVGLTGFCMGGKYTFLGAVTTSGPAAAVAWYGMLRACADRENPEHALDAPTRALSGARPVRRRRRADSAERRRGAAPARGQWARRSRSSLSGCRHAFANELRPETFRARRRRRLAPRARVLRETLDARQSHFGRCRAGDSEAESEFARRRRRRRPRALRSARRRRDRGPDRRRLTLVITSLPAAPAAVCVLLRGVPLPWCTATGRIAA